MARTERDAQVASARAPNSRRRERAPPPAARPPPCPASRHAPPRAGAGARIDQQRRDAVRDEDAKRDARSVGAERIGVRARQRRRIVARPYPHHGRVVNLASHEDGTARRLFEPVSGFPETRAGDRRPTCRPDSARSNGGSLTPPARVVNPWTNPGRRSPSSATAAATAAAWPSFIAFSSAASAASHVGRRARTRKRRIVSPVPGCTNPSLRRACSACRPRVSAIARSLRVARRPPRRPCRRAAGQPSAARWTRTWGALIPPRLEPRLHSRRPGEPRDHLPVGVTARFPERNARLENFFRSRADRVRQERVDAPPARPRRRARHQRFHKPARWCALNAAPSAFIGLICVLGHDQQPQR